MYTPLLNFFKNSCWPAGAGEISYLNEALLKDENKYFPIDRPPWINNVCVFGQPLFSSVNIWSYKQKIKKTSTEEDSCFSKLPKKDFRHSMLGVTFKHIGLLAFLKNASVRTLELLNSHYCHYQSTTYCSGMFFTVYISKHISVELQTLG